MTSKKLRAHWQFICCKTQRLPCDRFRHTIQFKQNVAGSHRGDPELGLALRFMLRVSATRAASSCVLVIQARSSVCNPNSPKSILRLRAAVPFRLPRWDFRYFTRFGINAINCLLYATGRAVAASLCEARASHRDAATELDDAIAINFLLRLRSARVAVVAAA